MIIRTLFTFFLLASVAHANALLDTDKIWANATEELTHGNTALARHDFTIWIEAQAANGVYSPQAHRNLALACWAEKDYGCASVQLLRSATISHSPFYNWEVANQITAIESQVGMKEGLSDDVAFRAFLIVNHYIVIWVGSIAGWMLLAALQAWTTRRRKFLGAPAGGLMLGALVLGLFAGAGWINQRYFSQYGVLSAREPSVPIFKDPQDTPDKKLADLPTGTVVRFAEQNPGATRVAVRITAPVTGWVGSGQILPVSPQ